MMVTVVGLSELVTHKWSEKAKEIMRSAGVKKPRAARLPRNPTEEYESHTYYTPDGKPAIPAAAFKKAIVNACRFVDWLDMTQARGALHVMGDLVEIQGERRMREDMVRVGMGQADIRYRPGFPKWSATLEIRYDADFIGPDQIAYLLNKAGNAVGVGEDRPEKKGGSWGMFQVE